MKAIQVKYIPCTKVRCSRMKVWAQHEKPVIVPFDHVNGVDAQAFEMACWYARKMKLGEIGGFGKMDDGTWCATLENSI